MQKILIVEDDADISFIINHILIDEGYTTLSLNTGAGIIQKVTEFMPNVILMDVWIGSEDGRNYCKLIKKEVALKNIPIIMMSAMVDKPSTYDGCQNDDVISKPFDIDDLLSKIKFHLGDLSPLKMR